MEFNADDFGYATYPNSFSVLFDDNGYDSDDNNEAANVPHSLAPVIIPPSSAPLAPTTHREHRRKNCLYGTTCQPGLLGIKALDCPSGSTCQPVKPRPLSWWAILLIILGIILLAALLFGLIYGISKGDNAPSSKTVTTTNFGAKPTTTIITPTTLVPPTTTIRTT